MSCVPLPWWTSQSTTSTRSPRLGQRRGGDGHVVEQAEAHGLGGAWRGGRAAAGRRRPPRPRPAAAPRPPRGPGPPGAGGGPRPRRPRGCRGRGSPTGGRELGQGVEVEVAVDASQLGQGRGTALELADGVAQVRLVEAPGHRHQAGGVLGVAQARVVVVDGCDGADQHLRLHEPVPGSASSSPDGAARGAARRPPRRPRCPPGPRSPPVRPGRPARGSSTQTGTPGCSRACEPRTTSHSSVSAGMREDDRVGPGRQRARLTRQRGAACVPVRPGAAEHLQASTGRGLVGVPPAADALDEHPEAVVRGWPAGCARGGTDQHPHDAPVRGAASSRSHASGPGRSWGG